MLDTIARTTKTIVETTEAEEGRVVRFAERPIDFETFLDLSEGTDLELVNGVMVEQMSAQLYHEKLYRWLSTILDAYVDNKGLGIVLGSRTAVEISQFGGRIPDILFVRQERADIVKEGAIYGAPDLVIEIASPNDRPSDIIALETDYRSIGVPEIWFLVPSKRRVRILRKRPQGYEETELRTGTLRSEVVAGFEIQVEWLFADPRPDKYETVTALLSASQRE
jgi:Uma2 family endonuclease